MKSKFLLLPILISILSGCSKRENEPFIPEESIGLDSLYQQPQNPFMGIPEKMSVVHVRTSAIKYNPWQKFYVSPVDATIIMWPSDDKTLAIKDVDKALEGIALDTKTNTEVKTENITKSSGIQLQDYRPGKYLIAVILDADAESGKRSYSSQEITLREYGKIYMHKIFSKDVKDGEFEEWSPKLIEK
ncbi:hypothetical protein [Sphingobacterium sp.]|uniref:hypothetical protein n=1 Tax=Sphingobacterium sp. TaxID=341027 RepID=UPI0028ACD6C4|nr:hypothetical protein [Sphingobacterium sp.]